MEQVNPSMKTNSNKKEYCVRRAFENLRRTKYQPSLKEMLNSVDQQMKQNRQQTEEYEKTVKLLRLVDKTPNIANISKLNKYR
jgi:hypothetical protein